MRKKKSCAEKKSYKLDIRRKPGNKIEKLKTQKDVRDLKCQFWQLMALIS
jgi:hypothetical protein